MQWDGDVVTFEAPLKKLDYIIFPLHQNLSATFISSGAIYLFQVQLIESIRKNNILIYTAKIVTPLTRQQQRSSFRLSTHFPFSFQLAADEDTWDNTMHPAICLNLSSGGMRLNTKPVLAPNTRLYVHFNFMNKDFSLMGETLDEGVKAPTGYYTYRLKFSYISFKEEETLMKLLIEKQREIIKIRR
jgi:c-di-GMP-binding flagellar brake protein YcgR